MCRTGCYPDAVLQDALPTIQALEDAAPMMQTALRLPADSAPPPWRRTPPSTAGP